MTTTKRSKNWPWFIALFVVKSWPCGGMAWLYGNVGMPLPRFMIGPPEKGIVENSFGFKLPERAEFRY